MALTITEVVKSQESDVGIEQSTRALNYTITGSEASDDVEALIQATIPAFYKGLQLQSYHFTHQGFGTWDAEARYASKQPKEIGQSSFTFDTTGGTQRLKKSKKTKSYVHAFDIDQQSVVDNGGAININGDKVDGVDVPIPKFGFTIQRIIADPLPTLYAAALEALTGCINLDTVVLNISGVIYTFAPFELRFEGATGGKRGTEAWEINLRCEVSRNVSNLRFPIPGAGHDDDFSDPTTPVGQVGDDDHIRVAFKGGWDYVWVQYEEAKVGNSLLPVPKQVNVEEVSDAAELSILFA